MKLNWQGARTHPLAIMLRLPLTMMAVARMPQLGMPAMEAACWTLMRMACEIKTKSRVAKIPRHAITILKPKKINTMRVITQANLTWIALVNA